MKRISSILLACSMGVGVQAQLIDDFSGGAADMNNYTQATVLSQGTNAVSTIGIASTPAETLQVSQANYGNINQNVYIRNDGWSLGVGQTLTVDVNSAFLNSAYSDFGLALMETASPTSVTWTSGTADGRNGLLSFYIKGLYDSVGYRASDASNTQLYSSSGVSVSGGAAALTRLWIARPSSTEFYVGYSTSAGDTLVQDMTGLDPTMGTGLGFYSDLRANTSYGYFDNLQILSTVIPEPASFAFFGLSGLLGLVAWMRRRIA